MDKSIAAAAVIAVEDPKPEKPTLEVTISELERDPKDEPRANVLSTAKAAVAASKDGVRVVALHEWREAAASLAEAFANDHSSMYFINTPDSTCSERERWELHLYIMECITYAHLLKGLVLCAGPNYDCVALWMPPGENMDDLWTILRSGLWRLYYKLPREGRIRMFNEFFPLLNDTKASVLGKRDGDSWYLVYIGTRPSGRGKGYARKCVEYVTRDPTRLCYLESSHHVNRIIYGKLGFKLQKNIYLQRDVEHVELDIMVREPVTKGSGLDAKM